LYELLIDVEHFPFLLFSANEEDEDEKVGDDDDDLS
jgi:hypothetical protein